MSQLSAIISRRTYNGWSDLTPECGQFEHQMRSQQTNCESAQLQLHSFYFSEFHRLQLPCTPTALATSKKPTCAGIRRPTLPTDTLSVRSTATDIDNTIHETHLRRRISLLKNHSSRRERLHKRSALMEKPTPRLKHIYDEKLSLD
jgi:hypothetical protein